MGREEKEEERRGKEKWREERGEERERERVIPLGR